MHRTRWAVVSVALVLVSGCTSADAQHARQAARDACISGRILQAAEERQETVSQLQDVLERQTRLSLDLLKLPSTPLEEKGRLLAESRVNIAKAEEAMSERLYLIYFTGYAATANRLYAAVDSARNHARTPEEVASQDTAASYARASATKEAAEHPSIQMDYETTFARLRTDTVCVAR
jgi:hypothetical protein